MRTTLNTVVVGLGLLIVTSSAWGQTEPGVVSGRPGKCKPIVNAALMISGGEKLQCTFGNIDDVYVVAVNVSTKSKPRRYILSSAEGCVVLPITAALGTHIEVTGVLQDTDAEPGASGLSDSASSVSENCFNVEGFSVGLGANSQSEYNPQDPANIINAQGYGFFWYDSDSDLKPGPYDYTVVGCSGHSCPTKATYYNTDSLPVPPACAVLDPLS